MMNEIDKYLIIVDDEEPKAVPGQNAGETPVITIEETTIPPQSPTFNHSPLNSSPFNTPPTPPPSTVHKKWLWFIGGLLLSTIICIAVVAGWRYYHTYVDIGIPVSTSDEQNIEKLMAKPPASAETNIIMTSDSILGVALNFYELKGLKAEISLQEPDTTDTSVWFYSRCADHGMNNEYLGSLVMNGKELQSDNTRLGYCAMANGNTVIGIARSEGVKDYVEEQGGSFFRQFILVSNGVLPREFHLHGKVERRGLGRIGEKLYYIETRHAETMWDFADALREYGFVDAIYITGGNDYSFYRTSDGTRHDIGDKEKYPHKKGKGVIPWLVFRKR